ncbi:MAG: ATP-binding protein [Sulfitobacter sp.]|nr:ATP-binding protein [Sulfitobacter sp.]
MGRRPPLPLFSISLLGVEDAVREGIAQTLAWLTPLELSEDETNTVQLVLAEALNNVVEHALAGTGGQTTVEIRGHHGASGLDLCIVDKGIAMPDGVVPRLPAPDVTVDVADLPDGGFGWFLIHTLAQDVTYVRRGKHNYLTLRLAVAL